MNANISISTDYLGDIAPEAALKEFAQGGFTHIELGILHGRVLAARGQQLQQIGQQYAILAADNGIAICQGHLVDDDICTPEGIDTLKAWIELFHGVGIKAAVLHATGVLNEPWEVQLEKRSNAIRQLLPLVEGTDMVLCLENLFSKPMVNDTTGISALIDAAGGSEHLGICLDIGHLHRCHGHGRTSMTSKEFIENAGHRLKALHVHDNHGIDDDHMPPFVSKGLDWKMFMQALSSSGYNGLFNMELKAETYTPMVIRRQRLKSLHSLAEFLLSEEFIHS